MRQGPFALAALLLLLAAPVFAAAPNYDRRAQAPPSASALSVARTRVDALRAVANVGETDDLFGVPTFLWAVPKARPSGAAARIGTRPTIDQAAPVELGRIAPFYGLDRADLSSASLGRVHDTGRGGIIATYRQRIGGIEVFGEELKLLMDRDMDLLAASGSLASHNDGSVGPFRLDAAAAVRRALEDFTGGAAPGIASLGAAPGGFEAFQAPAFAGQSDQPIRAKKVLFHLPGQFLPAWQVEVLGETEAYAYVFDANDGSLLFRKSLINDANFNYRVWADSATPFRTFDGPMGNAAQPVPSGTNAPFSPALVPPALVNLQNGIIPTNDPWLAPGATLTTGNNVDAYADFNSPDGFTTGDLRATTTSANTFDRVYDTNLTPSSSAAQRMASVTQLFYTTNEQHDEYYASGFDEASGNAQFDNLGRGGVGNDRLLAEAQDYSGTNNANMSTPSDGGSPRMQMYVFNPATVVTLTVNSPAGIAGAKASGRASFGPQNYSLTANAVLGIDGSGAANDGCSALTNGAAVSGKIVVLDRSTCSFTSQALNAQNAGAVGVIIVNNVAGPAPALGGTSGTVTIPVQSVTNTDGAAIKAQLGAGVNITMTGATQLQRDGSIDNQIVAHEYGHYVSNRLIGDAVGLGNNQGGGMGEGWGDFEALLLTVRAEDAALDGGQYAGCYSVGGYALSPSTAGGSTYYFGVRRFPYTTDMSKNPMTFTHIQDSATLPVGPPVNPNAGTNSEVHNTGSVWCTMLWECYASLLRDRGLSFDAARGRMRDYLVAAYKLTPMNPTITEARDALLAAALANDPQDHALFCAAFAKRGCGSGAISPPRYSTDNNGVVESYQCGGALQFVSADVLDDIGSCDNDGVLDNGEFGNLKVTLRNTGAVNLNATTVTVTSSNPAVTFPVGNVMNVPASTPFTEVTGQLEVGVSGAASVSPLDFSFAIADPGLVVAAPSGGLFVQGNGDIVPSTTENVELPTPSWTPGGNPLVESNAWARTLFTNNWSFFGPDAGGISDQWLATPALQVAATGNFTFSFQERHSFETSSGTFYDGGVLEITQNDGASWTDIGASASPGYGGTLFTGSNNPLSGRSAYVGANAAYPNFTTVNVNLGTTYAGKTVKIRWRIATDEAAGEFGWAIDNLTFNNLVNQPFQGLVTDPGPCNLVAAGNDLPTEFAFGIAGANPGRTIAPLRFALPKAAHVTIALYDVAGRRVAQLANDDFDAGWHTTPARTDRLAGGVYFARMDVAGRQFVKRLVILQ